MDLSADLMAGHFGNSHKGFTLLDLLLVMMIMGVVGMIAIPRFPSLVAETKLNEAAGEMVSALHYARNLAVRYQRPFGLKATIGSNCFSVFDDQHKSDPNSHQDADPPVASFGVVWHPVEKQWYEKDFDTSGLYEGVDIIAVPSGNIVLFYPEGHSSESGTIFVLSASGNSRSIMVNGTTGWVNVQ